MKGNQNSRSIIPFTGQDSFTVKNKKMAGGILCITLHEMKGRVEKG